MVFGFERENPSIDYRHRTVLFISDKMFLTVLLVLASFVHVGLLAGTDTYSERNIMYSTTAMTWSSAWSTCVQNSGHLISVDDNVTMSVLEYLFNLTETSGMSGPIWTGLHSIVSGSDPEYNWANCDPIGNFTPWMDNEPTTPEDNRCTTAGKVKLLLRTQPCNGTYVFVCEEDKASCSYAKESDTICTSADPSSRVVLEGEYDDKNCKERCSQDKRGDEFCWAYEREKAAKKCTLFFGFDPYLCETTGYEKDTEMARRRCFIFKDITGSKEQTVNSPIPVSDCVPTTVSSTTTASTTIASETSTTSTNESDSTASTDTSATADPTFTSITSTDSTASVSPVTSTTSTTANPTTTNTASTSTTANPTTTNTASTSTTANPTTTNTASTSTTANPTTTNTASTSTTANPTTTNTASTSTTANPTTTNTASTSTTANPTTTNTASTSTTANPTTTNTASTSTSVASTTRTTALNTATTSDSTSTVASTHSTTVTTAVTLSSSTGVPTTQTSTIKTSDNLTTTISVVTSTPAVTSPGRYVYALCISVQFFTPAERKKRTDDMVNELTLDKKNLSSYLRTKSSAKDQRASAKNVGGVGIFLMIIAVLIIIVPDIITLAMKLSKIFKKKSD